MADREKRTCPICGRALVVKMVVFNAYTADKDIQNTVMLDCPVCSEGHSVIERLNNVDVVKVMPSEHEEILRIVRKGKYEARVYI